MDPIIIINALFNLVFAIFILQHITKISLLAKKLFTDKGDEVCTKKCYITYRISYIIHTY